jgi:hypothetical protein
MKLQLTAKAEAELEIINQKLIDAEENDNEYEVYDELTEHETLVTDAGLYVDGAYEENEFSNLEKWCKNVGKSEFVPKYLKKHPTAVLDKVNKMIQEGLVVVAE